MSQALRTKYGDASSNIFEIYTYPNPSTWLNSISCSTDGKYAVATRINYNVGADIGYTVLLSSDYGKNWNRCIGIQHTFVISSAMSSNGQYIIVGTINREPKNVEPISNTPGYTIPQLYANIYMSNNYGETWRKIFGEDNNSVWGIYALTISDNGQYLTNLTLNGDYYISTNSGNHWNKINKINNGLGSKITASSNGKYICRTFDNSNNIYTSLNYGTEEIANWKVTQINTGDGNNIVSNTNIKLSSTGKILVAIANHPTKGRCIYISKNFIESLINNNNPTWTKTEFPSLMKYKYVSPTDISNGIPVTSSASISYNNREYTNVSTVDASWNPVTYSDIAISDNGQNIIALCRGTSSSINSKTYIHEDANIFISNNFGDDYRSIIPTNKLDFPYCSYDFNTVNTTSSGQCSYYTSSQGVKHNIYKNGLTAHPRGYIYNCITDNYTYSYTPIKIAYNNTFNFTFTSTLYDCSGTYYLKNENDQILSTKVIDTDTTTSITFTDISTNLFDYGMSRLFVYKSDIVELGDIQISDPMVINATCFLEGTKILAMDKRRIMKYIPIEKLKPGMLVQTLSSGFVPIKYIGYSTIYNPGLATRVRDQLFKCTKSAYPELTEDLVLTGNHSILVDTITDEEREQITETLGGIYVTERKYRLPAFNDKRAVPYEERGDFRIWNLALENENYYANYGIYANGLLVETTSCRYLKEISRMTLIE